MILGFTASIYVLADASSFRLLYLLFAALLLVFIFSQITVRRAPRGFSLSRKLGKNPCNEKTVVDVELTVTTKRYVSGLVLTIEDDLPEGLVREGRSSSTSSGQVYLRQRYRIRAEGRGIYTVGPARVRVADFFGLWTSSFQIGEGSRLVAYPEHAPVEVFRGRESTEMMGVSTTEQKGASSDFLRIRPYEPGDEVRTIHWRSSAKTGRLMVRELEKEEIRSTIIVLNCEESSNRDLGEVFERGVRIAASIAVSSLRKEMEVKMVLYGEQREIVSSGRGRVQYHRLLSALSAVQPGGDTPLSYILDRLSREGGTGTIHIVTPSMRDRDVKSLSYLIRRGISPAVVLTAGPDRANLPEGLLDIQGRVGYPMDMGKRTVISWMN